MFKLALLLLLVTVPVLHEGRYKPLDVVPEGAAYQELQVNDYSQLAGTPYLQTENKQRLYPTQMQLKIEILLYQIPFKWLIIFCYLMGLLFLKKVATFIGFLIHTLLLVMQCYVLSRPPVSNMAETILYVPWIALLFGLIFRKRPYVLGCATIASILLLLFLPLHPALENVIAVLDSRYWLIVHVLMVVASYGAFFVAGLCGHWYLLHKKPPFLLEKTLIQILYIGTILLICGTILGGVWAAESWGRFWDWDPKEGWAFISSGIYLISIHAYRLKKIGGGGLALGSIFGLMSITFTWYGVNYILSTGMHSYGFGNGGVIYYYLYLASEICFVTTILLLKKKIIIVKKVRLYKKR